MLKRRTERWSSRIGIVLAVAGSAIGLGNYFRFPTLVATYGGWAFLVPYLCALVLVGLPLLWMEGAWGRYGGIWGRHSLPGIYDRVTRKPWGKYLGILGLYLPFIIVVYYLYIESWVLGFAYFGVTRAFPAPATGPEMTTFLQQYLDTGSHFSAVPLALIFLAVTLLINFIVAYRGAEAGISKLNQIALPLLCLFSAFMVVQIFKQPAAQEAMNFIWKPQPELFKSGAFWNPNVWMAAIGQVLFSFTLGLGAVITYSSYLRKDDDVALTGLSTASFNAFAEVILGLSIALPAAIAIFGLTATQQLAGNGTFTLGFYAMPLIFQQMPNGSTFCALWFLLLFFAGMTSSVSLLQPMLAFFHDELGWGRKRATMALLGLTVLLLAPVVLLQRHGFHDQLDFWAVHVLLPIGALIEVLLFISVLGMKRGWEGITTGARIRVPGIFRFVMLCIMPLFLLVVIVAWCWQYAGAQLMLTGVKPEEQPYLIAARVAMGVIFLVMMLVIKFAWQQRLDGEEQTEIDDEEASHVR